MQQGFIYGWDSENERWVKVTADSQGRLIIDPSNLSGDYNLSTRTLYKYKNGVNIITNCGESLYKEEWEGAFAIRFPKLFAMLTIEGIIYIHDSDKMVKFVCGGIISTYGNYWNQVTAILLTQDSHLIRVRFGHSDSGDYYIIFGETSDSWDHGRLSLDRLTVHHAHENVTNWDNEVYAVEMDTLPDNIDRDISDARI